MSFITLLCKLNGGVTASTQIQLCLEVPLIPSLLLQLLLGWWWWEAAAAAAVAL